MIVSILDDEKSEDDNSQEMPAENGEWRGDPDWVHEVNCFLNDSFVLILFVCIFE